MTTKDIKWTGRDIALTPDNDFATVSGQALLEQSIAILVAGELDDLSAQVLSTKTVTDIEDAINRAVDRDVDIGTVSSLQITEINRQTDTVTVKGRVTQDDESDIIVEV